MKDPRCKLCFPNDCVHGEQSLSPDEVVSEQRRLEVVALGVKLADLQKQLDECTPRIDGLVAQLAAAKRERDVATLAIEVEREACAILIVEHLRKVRAMPMLAAELGTLIRARSKS